MKKVGPKKDIWVLKMKEYKYPNGTWNKEYYINDLEVCSTGKSIYKDRLIKTTAWRIANLEYLFPDKKIDGKKIFKDYRPTKTIEDGIILAKEKIEEKIRINLGDFAVKNVFK